MASSGALLGRIDWPGRTSIIQVDDVADVLVDLAVREEAASEVYCSPATSRRQSVSSRGRSPGFSAGRARQSDSRPLLSAAQALVWNRTVQAAVPRFARVPIWRLSLMVSDGFWFETAKFRSVRKPLEISSRASAIPCGSRSSALQYQT
jgi:hypothetical protein